MKIEAKTRLRATEDEADGNTTNPDSPDNDESDGNTINPIPPEKADSAEQEKQRVAQGYKEWQHGGYSDKDYPKYEKTIDQAPLLNPKIVKNIEDQMSADPDNPDTGGDSGPIAANLLLNP